MHYPLFYLPKINFNLPEKINFLEKNFSIKILKFEDKHFGLISHLEVVRALDGLAQEIDVEEMAKEEKRFVSAGHNEQEFGTILEHRRSCLRQFKDTVTEPSIDDDEVSNRKETSDPDYSNAYYNSRFNYCFENYEQKLDPNFTGTDIGLEQLKAYSQILTYSIVSLELMDVKHFEHYLPNIMIDNDLGRIGEYQFILYRAVLDRCAYDFWVKNRVGTSFGPQN